MEKKYEVLIPFVNKYKDEMAAVEIRRNLWNEKLKALITQSFADFIEAFDLPCYIDEQTELHNQEAVYLAFEDKETGIVIKANNQSMIQTGGGLVYHQNANGKISVTFILPFVDGIKGTKGEKKDIVIVKPEDVDEELILSHIQMFFKEILEWECFLRQMIGFNH